MKLSPKLYFMLERLRRDMAEWWRGIFYRAERGTTSNRMCPSCRALISRKDSKCPMCGVDLRIIASRSASPGMLGGVFPVSLTATSALATINIGLYVLTFYLSFRTAQLEMTGTPGFGGIRIDTLVDFGAKWGPGILRNGEWWRLVTATFLHGNLMHIGFNILFKMLLG